MIERHGEYAMRQLSPQSIVSAECGQCTRCSFAFVLENTTNAYSASECIVPLANQMR